LDLAPGEHGARGIELSARHARLDLAERFSRAAFTRRSQAADRKKPGLHLLLSAISIVELATLVDKGGSTS